MDPTARNAFVPLTLARSIRILALQPAASGADEDDDALVVVTISEVSLDEGPDYEAVSYTRGDESATEKVMMNGTEVAVAKSLAAGLRRFRGRGDAVRHLWVDALCVNLADEQEKSGQVALMADVYEQARRVLVWLGDNTAHTRPALETLAGIAGRAEEFGLSKTTSSWVSFTQTLRGDYRDVYKLLQSTLAVKLEDILGRAWFTRLWVVQEVTLSRSALLHCGSETMDWDEFVTAMAVLMAGMRTTRLKIGAQEEFARAWRLVDLVATQRARLQREKLGIVASPSTYSSPYAEIRALQARLCPLQCVDPRDRIHAISGLGLRAMAAQPAFDDDTAGSAIPPDYTKTTAQTFTDFARHLVVQGDIFLLHDAGLAKRLAREEWQQQQQDRGRKRTAEPDVDEADEHFLPSWVPDLSREATYDAIQWYCDDFAAGGTVQLSEPGLSYDPTCLFVHIRSLGRVTRAMSDPSLTLHGPARDIGSVVENFFDCVREHASFGFYALYERGPNPEFDAFGRTISADGAGAAFSRVFDDCPDRETLLERFYAFVRCYMSRDGEIRRRWAEYSAGGLDISDERAFLQGLGDEAVTAWRFGTVVSDVFAGNAFVATEEGYFGVAPGMTEPGDYVALVAGLPTPYVLRPIGEGAANGRFAVVGACYVHGFMFGEGAAGPEAEFGQVCLQ